MLSMVVNSCVNKDYDIDKLDTEITLASEGLELPLGKTAPITIKDLLKDMDLNEMAVNMFYANLSTFCLWAIPCILITGPIQAGLAYVTRNWARDEHAFPWADFRDAVKDNWKQALGVSAITSVLPYVLLICYLFYGQMQQQSMLFLVPQMLTLVLGFVWWLGLVFMYPLMVSYKMKFGQVIKNGLMLAIARLPMTIGVRLATLIPTGIAFVVALLVPNGFLYAMMGLAGYYLILGNSMTRFVDASFTNAVFDKYINSRIEGVEINRGLAKEEDDDYTDEDEPEDDHPAAQQ